MDNIFNKNKILAAEEYKIGQAKLNSFPINMELLISTQCNLNCFMCRFGVYKKDFSTEITPQIYQRLRSLFPYLEILKLNGAEIFNTPYDGKQFVDNIIMDSLQFKNMKIACSTNGILIGKERAEIIVEKFDRLEVSLDTSDENVYHFIRGGAELNVLLENISLINKLKKEKGLRNSDAPQLNFSAIVMEKTYKNIPDLVNLTAELGGASLGLRPLSCDLKEPEWQKIKSEDIFSSKEKTLEWLNISKKASEIAILKNIEYIDTSINLAEELYPDLINYNELEEDSSLPIELCNFPWNNLYIGSKGYVTFALCSGLIIGDINRSRFAEIWNGKIARYIRKSFINGDYTKCSSFCQKNYLSRGMIIQKDDLLTKIRKKINW